MKIIDQSQKLQSSGHCCMCAGVCRHIGPINLCARHERMEANRREGMSDENAELRAALAEANLKLEAMKAKVVEVLRASGTISKENRELRAAIIEWDQTESIGPEELAEELTEDNLDQTIELYRRHLAACDRLRAIAKGSAL